MIISALLILLLFSLTTSTTLHKRATPCIETCADPPPCPKCQDGSVCVLMARTCDACSANVCKSIAELNGLVQSPKSTKSTSSSSGDGGLTVLIPCVFAASGIVLAATAGLFVFRKKHKGKTAALEVNPEEAKKEIVIESMPAGLLPIPKEKAGEEEPSGYQNEKKWSIASSLIEDRSRRISSSTNGGNGEAFPAWESNTSKDSASLCKAVRNTVISPAKQAVATIETLPSWEEESLDGEASCNAVRNTIIAPAMSHLIIAEVVPIDMLLEDPPFPPPESVPPTPSTPRNADSMAFSEGDTEILGAEQVFFDSDRPLVYKISFEGE